MGKVPAEVLRADSLDPTEVAEVLALGRTAGDVDGAHPLSERALLHLRRGGPTGVHLRIRGDGRLVGYAHVDTSDRAEGACAELCVHPLYRRRGLGRALVLAAIQAAQEDDPAGRLRLWAHGNHPSANALALSLGFLRTRTLWQMRRPLAVMTAQPDLPEGIRLRHFRPDADDTQWLALNARAFADHPDQGRWTADDLAARLAEPWFDPAGFILAERATDGQLLGFHWTKVHGSHRPVTDPQHQHDPIGEVYVLGVDPQAHGQGLGAALTVAGLHHLRGQGLDQAMLYVEESNLAALRLYTGLGFVHWSTDVSFRRDNGIAEETAPAPSR